MSWMRHLCNSQPGKALSRRIVAERQRQRNWLMFPNRIQFPRFSYIVADQHGGVVFPSQNVDSTIKA